MLCRTGLLFDSTLAGLMDSGQDTGVKTRALGAENVFLENAALLQTVAMECFLLATFLYPTDIDRE